MNKCDKKDAKNSALKPGITVKIISLNKYAEVISETDRKGFVKLRYGGVELKIKESDLLVSSTSKGKKSKVKPTNKFQSTNKQKFSLDLHGKNKEEAKIAILNIINKASLDNAEQVEIIHGIGTYALKNYLYILLKEIKVVKSFNLELTNPGKTIVWLG